MRLIDADDIVNTLGNTIEVIGYDGKNLLLRGQRIGLNSAIGQIRNAPTVEAEPIRHGKWLPVYYDNQPMICACSLCDRRVINKYDLPRYCPNCGAKMDEDTQDE